MKSKKIITGIVVCIIVLIAFFIGIFVGRNSEIDVDEEKMATYKIDILNLEEVSSVTIDTLSEFNNKKEFTDKEKIDAIYNVFANKTTNKESINDNPVEPDRMYSVVFKNDKGDYTLAYIYEKNNKYYIEQPYNGIYDSSEEEFKKIEVLMK